MGLRDELPTFTGSATNRNWTRTASLCVAALTFAFLSRSLHGSHPPSNAKDIIARCAELHAIPGVPAGFHERSASDRFEEGTRATLIRNATIWTGGRNGTEVVFGDLLLDKGLIKAVGYIPKPLLHDAAKISGSLDTIDADGAWITPGIFDLHSHIGLLSAPSLIGAIDVNSPNGPVLPWLRSLDALNTRDESYKLAVAGGLTGGLILPGSGNIIGGQAFPIKYRKTSQRTPSSLLIEPPFSLNGSNKPLGDTPLRWRHMKHATGENQRSHGTRMDSSWGFREAYEEARKVKESQDSFCRKVERGQWDDPEVQGRSFPENLKWEALVDVLRGRVKVNCHTYEAVDLDFLSRLTNEFKFRIAAIHHAHEAYLVPETLKKFWGGAPTVAIFATNARYKRESYRGSEFAGRILADNGINVVYKSDHPVINSRYLPFEAQQAHFYSLPANLALRSLTTEPAIALGLDHRMGSISEGYDADLVIWDSHPLALGATPKQVFIDGIPQLEDPQVLAEKGAEFQKPPQTPSWDDEIKMTLEHDGLPPLRSEKKLRDVEFLNVKSLWQRQRGKVMNAFEASQSDIGNHTVIVSGGKVTCVGTTEICVSAKSTGHKAVDLKGGSLSIGITTVGSPLGLSEIPSEPGTSDSQRYQPLSENAPKILNDQAGAIAAVDGLQFEGRDTLLAYRFGVTSAVSSWSWMDVIGPNPGTFAGLSVAFRTGAAHGLEKGAVIKPHAALHVVVGHNGGPSVSTQIAAIRDALLGKGSGNTRDAFVKAAKGELPFIVDTSSADIMVNMIKLKTQVEGIYESSMNMAFSGASEAHIIADEIAEAGISVILKPVRAHPATWDGRRIVPGLPLTKDTALTRLTRKGVNVAIGVTEKWEPRNTIFDVAWAALDSDGFLGKADALSLVTTNLDKIFGFDKNEDEDEDDLVAYEGGDLFSLGSKVVAVISPRNGHVEIF